MKKILAFSSPDIHGGLVHDSKEEKRTVRNNEKGREARGETRT